MFILNIGRKKNVAAEPELGQSLIYLSAHNDLEGFAQSQSESSTLLFDPQLYLAGLSVKKHKKTCCKLATLPWFQISERLPKKGKLGLRAWRDSIPEVIDGLWGAKIDPAKATTSAIKFQQQFRCSKIILPSPLIVDREDEAETQGVWLDVALKISSSLDVSQPLLFTVAISEEILNAKSFESGGYLDVLVDQLTSRYSQQINGVYLVVLQKNSVHPLKTPESVLKAYLHLSKMFSKHGEVVVNFADVFGLPCLAVGASMFATGPSQALRRLCLSNYEDDGFGKALPHYYSHQTIAEYLSETDLDEMVSKGLLRRVKDVTPYSKDLIELLERGRSAAELPTWAENQNNISQAQKHFASRMLEEGKKLSSLSANGKRQYVRDWLEDADVNAVYVKSKIKRLKGDAVSVESWSRIVSEIG